MMTTIRNILLVLFIGMFLINCSCSKKTEANHNVVDSAFLTRPLLSGKLIFHSYSCYSCNDSKMYLYDFASNQLRNLSSHWNIINPMNAHFSPIGNDIVFMGESSITNSWDVFIWDINSSNEPINLTANFGNKRDEDPKFSNDGTRIVFKQNGIMKIMDTVGNILNSFNGIPTEASMPYFMKGDSSIVFSKTYSNATTAAIFKYSLSNNTFSPVIDIPAVEAYYPIAIDDSSFYFSRWYSPDNHNDQVYVGYLNGQSSQRLSFNETFDNFSDAYPINNKYLVISSTKTGGSGAYDLYIADQLSGKTWSINVYNSYINSVGNELGACYRNR